MSETAGKALIPTRELTTEQVTECLAVLARRGGNSAAASEELERRGYAVPDATLRTWRLRTFVDRYLEIASGLSRKEAEEGIAQAYRETVVETQDLTARLRERLGENLDQIDVKDLPKAHRELTLAGAIAFDKYYATQDRPTQIVEVRNPDWYTQALAEQLKELTIDGTAEEITESADHPDFD